MSTTQSAERRRFTRFASLGRLTGQLLDWGVPSQIQDISFGGFALETPTWLDAGVEHRVRFVARDQWSTVLQARLANCRPAVAADGSSCFVAGFSFLTAAEESAPAVVSTGYRLRKFLLTLRYMPRLFQQPWQSQWIESVIDEKLGVQRSPVQILIEKARLTAS